MRNYRIAERYARVLVKQAEHDKRLEKVNVDINNIVELIHKSPAFPEFLKNPVIPIEKRKEILEKLFEHDVEDLTYRFLLLIAEKKRLSELPRICEVFQRLYDEINSIVRAKVLSVCALRHDQLTSISNKLKKLFNKEVNVENTIDKSLLGGFKVQIGDLIYDYTIRTQLDKYREAVMNV